MGEIAEMMIDGTLCSQCGSYIHSDGYGVPRLCSDCRKDRNKSRKEIMSHKPYTNDELKTIITMIKQGFYLRQIVEKLPTGRSYGSVARQIKRLRKLDLI